MPREQIEIGVVVARRKLKGPWASHQWLSVAVLPAAPEAAAGTLLGRAEGGEIFYAGPAWLDFRSGDTAHYRDNLQSERPSLWVSLRPTLEDWVEIALVTADPYEGEALAQSVGEEVEAVPMPADIRDRLAAFVAAHHVERPFFKRQRKKADPEALARGGPGPDPASDED